MRRIQDVLSEYRIPYRAHGESPHVSEGWIGLECCFCGRGTGKFGLGYRLRDGYTKCWKCGPHWIVEVLEAYTGEKRKTLKGLVAGVELSRVPADHDRRGVLKMPKGVGPLLKPHRRYLTGRGFDPDELVDLWKIGGIGPAAKLDWRIYIPIHDANEDVVSWTTRAISDDVPHTFRYRGAKRTEEVIPRSRVLYGEQYARHSVVVFEGPFDCWAVGPGAVCTCGTGFSTAQVRRIAKFPVRAVCFDRGIEAQRRARQLARLLEPFPGETYVVTLAGKDAASSPKEARQLRRRFLE